MNELKKYLEQINDIPTQDRDTMILAYQLRYYMQLNNKREEGKFYLLDSALGIQLDRMSKKKSQIDRSMLVRIKKLVGG
jgi:hypothetical protein